MMKGRKELKNLIDYPEQKMRLEAMRAQLEAMLNQTN
jgi:hypothetical protein